MTYGLSRKDLPSIIKIIKTLTHGYGVQERLCLTIVKLSTNFAENDLKFKGQGSPSLPHYLRG